MMAVILEGSDGVGKTTHLRLAVQRMQRLCERIAAAPSLNTYLTDVTGLDHLSLREWRLHKADPDEYTRLLLAAHRWRLAEIEHYHVASICFLDRGIRTIEAGCAALADYRKTALAAISVSLLRDEPEFLPSARVVRIALLYSRDVGLSMQIFAQREPDASPSYIAYQSFLQRRLIQMAESDCFDSVIWVQDRPVQAISDQVVSLVTEGLGRGNDGF